MIDDPAKYLCDVCGKSCEVLLADGWSNQAVATLKASWPYGSRRDTEYHECHVCQDCYERVFEFIEKELHGRVSVTSIFTKEEFRRRGKA